MKQAANVAKKIAKLPLPAARMMANSFANDMYTKGNHGHVKMMLDYLIFSASKDQIGSLMTAIGGVVEGLGGDQDVAALLQLATEEVQ